MTTKTKPCVVPAWVRRFMDIPFREHGRDWHGCDCWGLYRLAFNDRFGIWLPSKGEAYGHVTDGQNIESALKEFGTENPLWREVESGAERMGDALLMTGYYACNGRWHRANMHVGFMIVPGIILHTEQGVDTALCHYRDDRRYGKRLIGIYRCLLLEGAEA